MRSGARAVGMVCLLACGTVSAVGAEPVRLVRVPEGGIQPQVAVDDAGVMHLIYFKGEPAAGDIYYRRSEDGGRSFGAAMRVNSEDGSAVATGTIRGAHLAVGREGRVHVAWMGSSRTFAEGHHLEAPMLYARLKEEGEGFEAQRNLMTRTHGLDGGGSIGADGAGNVYVAWHASRDDELPEEMRRTLFVARSTDGGRTFGRERAVDPDPAGACGCCGMRAYAEGDGRAYFLYRTARELMHRDMRLVFTHDAGRTFRGQIVDRWEIAACPMSSSQIAPGDEGALVAWETEGQVYWERFDPSDGSTTAAVPAPGRGGARKHPAVASDGSGRVLLAWVEGSGWAQGGELVWQLFDRDGRPLPEGGGRGGEVPVWSLVAAAPRADGGFVIIY